MSPAHNALMACDKSPWGHGRALSVRWLTRIVVADKPLPAD